MDRTLLELWQSHPVGDTQRHEILHLDQASVCLDQTPNFIEKQIWGKIWKMPKHLGSQGREINPRRTRHKDPPASTWRKPAMSLRVSSFKKHSRQTNGCAASHLLADSQPSNLEHATAKASSFVLIHGDVTLRLLSWLLETRIRSAHKSCCPHLLIRWQYFEDW